jgi:hypothetical protein
VKHRGVYKKENATSNDGAGGGGERMIKVEGDLRKSTVPHHLDVNLAIKRPDSKCLLLLATTAGGALHIRNLHLDSPPLLLCI